MSSMTSRPLGPKRMKLAERFTTRHGRRKSVQYHTPGQVPPIVPPPGQNFPVHNDPAAHNANLDAQNANQAGQNGNPPSPAQVLPAENAADPEQQA